jgi:adenylyl-sulfate kinase
VTGWGRTLAGPVKSGGDERRDQMSATRRLWRGAPRRNAASQELQRNATAGPARFAEVTDTNGHRPLGLAREGRDGALGSTGLTLWLTGLPAAGKSTIAAAVHGRLAQAGRPACWLDGDRLRAGLNRDLGFDAASRAESVRRTAEVARLFADAGGVAIVSLVSPYACDRDQARDLHERAGLSFHEVWIATPLAECERRDPKGLYARARCGELSGMTGVDDPYEPPAAPDLELDGRHGVERNVDLVLRLIGVGAEPTGRFAGRERP